MAHSTLAPVFTGLRLGLHALLVGLACFAVVRAFAEGSAAAPWVLAVAALFGAAYLAGAWAARPGGLAVAAPHGLAVAWVSALTLLWGLLVWLSPEGAFLVFPLFFLYLHLLPGAAGFAAIVVTAAFAIGALGLHHGFSVGGVIGPLVGAGVALLIGLAYRTLMREADERERLLAELLRTRERLAGVEREQGALAERARLARDIHDTVAQGLSSIQMLLHAAERGAAEPAAGYLRLARETAAESLAETRQIIRELTPARLDDGLGAALRRLADEQSRRAGVRIDVSADEIELPMEAQTALLRVAQGAISNAIRHAGASLVTVVLSGGEGSGGAPDAGIDPEPGAVPAPGAAPDPVPGSAGGAGSALVAAPVMLVVRDDGRGFDPAGLAATPHGADSFGLRAMRERAEQLGGRFEVESAPGRGTAVTIRLDPSAGRADDRGGGAAPGRAEAAREADAAGPRPPAASGVAP